MKEEKIYIIPGNLNSYFLFIDKLFKYKYIKKVSKELQVLIIHPDQLRGIQGKVFLLSDAYKNSQFPQIQLQLQLRAKVLQVFECSPVVSEVDFLKLFHK